MTHPRQRRLGVWFGLAAPLTWVPVTMTKVLRQEARRAFGDRRTGRWTVAMPPGYTQWEYFIVGKTVLPNVGAWPYHFLDLGWGPSPRFRRHRPSRMAGK